MRWSPSFRPPCRPTTAQIHYAQVQLDYATITAPLAGRVGARLVDPGNIVHASDTNGLVVINQIDPIAVVFTLPGDTVQAINRAPAGSRSTCRCWPTRATATRCSRAAS